jgi:site-specific DNA-cytosine methylase
MDTIMTLTHIDLFAGVGGFAAGFEQSGIQTVAHVEIDKQCQQVLHKHWPDHLILSDVCEAGAHNLPYADIISFGSPCFPAGTLVLTEHGYLPIEEVGVGMKVLTHVGRWKRVLANGWHLSDTIKLSGQGHYGIESTPDHPYWGAETVRHYPRYADGKRGSIRTLGEPTWVPAKEMVGKRMALIGQVESLRVPEIPRPTDRFAIQPEMNEDFWWMIGRWLADGWVRNGQRSQRPDGECWGQVYICAGYHNAAMVEERLNRVAEWQKFEERTVMKFRLNRKGLANWINRQFGKGALNKGLPAWVFGMPEAHRISLMDGYFSADGWTKKDGSRIVTTVSKNLAFSMRLLAEGLDYATALYFVPVAPTKVIEGRTVNQHNQYQVAIRKDKRTNTLPGYGCSWHKVRKVEPAQQMVPVYNLEVEQDNTYVVEGIVVHNCQDLSVAGKRQGLEGARSGLFFEAVRIINEVQPQFAIWENVPGALSSNAGRDFQAVLSQMLGADVPMPRSGRWARSGMARSGQRTLAWRVLDSQYFGLAQRRKRVFIVLDLRGERAVQILLEPEGLRRDSPPRREAGQGYSAVAGTLAASGAGLDRPSGNGNQLDFCIPDVAPTIRGRFDSSPRGDGYDPIIVDHTCLNPWDHETKRIHLETGISPTLAGSDGKGGQRTHYVAQAVDCRNLVLNEEVSGTLQAKENGSYSLNYQNPVLVPQAFGGNNTKNPLDVATSLTAHGSPRMDFASDTFVLDFLFPAFPTEVIAFVPGQGAKAVPVGIGGSDLGFTLRANPSHSGDKGDGGLNTTMVALSPELAFQQNTRDEVRFMGGDGEIAGALAAEAGMKQQNYLAGYGVRRLTPVECARLQGFEDDWNSFLADTARYKQYGNAVSVNVTRWLGGRIKRYAELQD